NGRAVGQHFGNTLHHFGGVVAHADYGVGAVFTGVLQHKFERILAGFLAEVGENGDVAADNGLQRGAQIPDDAARPDDNSPDNSIVSDDAIPRQLDRRGHHACVHSWHISSSLKQTFTAAILAAHTARCEHSFSVTLG